MPLEVEGTLQQSGEFDDVVVIGLPDANWGQVVVACYPPRTKELDTQKVDAVLEALTAYKRPKHYYPITPWPRNAQGKIKRSALVAAITGRQPA